MSHPDRGMAKIASVSLAPTWLGNTLQTGSVHTEMSEMWHFEEPIGD